jgi:hypothetical protein
VSLLDVDELTLDRLVNAAITDAAANEVTPPVTTGDEWSPARIAWLKDFHRNRRDGLLSYLFIRPPPVTPRPVLRESHETGNPAVPSREQLHDDGKESRTTHRRPF